MQSKIFGTVMPVLELSKQPDDKVFAESGQLSWMSMAVQTGHVGMYQESVQFNLTTISGIKNAFFGGDGIFLAALTGPGRVWLQSMTMQHLAHAIQEYLPKPG